MPRSKIGLNIRQLREVFEPNRQSPTVNLNIKVIKPKSIVEYVLFTLTILTVILIIATVIEHKSKLNTCWKIWSNIFQTIENLVSRRKNNLLLWTNQTPGEKAFAIITILNVVIYLAWFVNNWKFVMSKYFIINGDESSSIWSLLLSAFSHTSLWNLITNVAYLYPLCRSGFIGTWPMSTFSPFMGIEEFFVMYISACLFCSLSRIYVERKLNITENKCGAVSLCLVFVIVMIILRLENVSWIDSVNVINGCIFGMFWYELGSKIIWHNRKYLLIDILK